MSISQQIVLIFSIIVGVLSFGVLSWLLVRQISWWFKIVFTEISPGEIWIPAFATDLDAVLVSSLRYEGLSVEVMPILPDGTFGRSVSISRSLFLVVYKKQPAVK